MRNPFKRTEMEGDFILKEENEPHMDRFAPMLKWHSGSVLELRAVMKPVLLGFLATLPGGMATNNKRQK